MNTLYAHPMSGASRRVLAFAAVYDVPLEVHVVDLMKGAHKAPDYLALNPSGRVPTLVVEGEERALWESAAILSYLAELYAPDTLGETPEQRALVMQWGVWGVAHFGGALGALNVETGLKRMRGGEPDASVVATLTEAVDAQLNLLAGASSIGDGFVAGTERPSTADFILAAPLEACQWISGFEPKSPVARAWMTRMTSLPGWPAAPHQGA